MALPIGIPKRYLYCIIIAVSLIIVILVTGGGNQKRHMVINCVVGQKDRNSNPEQSSSANIIGAEGSDTLKQLDPRSRYNQLTGDQAGSKVYRYNNGRIMVGKSHNTPSKKELEHMSPSDLEIMYENAVLEATADCSTSRRYGLREDGGWDLCLVGPFTPKKPCFSFSFGINNVWGFDDEVAETFQCQVFTFDPSMSQESHMRSDNVVFIKEGLYSGKGSLNSWSMNSYRGFLECFGAQNYIIDILKIDIEASEWTALETAVQDGSLNNVKQLLLETHVSTVGTAKDLQRYFAVLQAIHDLGFRQWRHNWNTFGNYNSTLDINQVFTCCHELYYININFLNGRKPTRNPVGTRIVAPLKSIKVS